MSVLNHPGPSGSCRCGGLSGRPRLLLRRRRSRTEAFPLRRRGNIGADAAQNRPAGPSGDAGPRIPRNDRSRASWFISRRLFCAKPLHLDHLPRRPHSLLLRSRFPHFRPMSV